MKTHPPFSSPFKSGQESPLLSSPLLCSPPPLCRRFFRSPGLAARSWRPIHFCIRFVPMLVNWTCCNSKREREGGRKTEKVWVIPTKRQSANVPGYVQNDTTCTRAHTTGFAWRTERDGTRERERERERQKFEPLCDRITVTGTWMCAPRMWCTHDHDSPISRRINHSFREWHFVECRAAGSSFKSPWIIIGPFFFFFFFLLCSSFFGTVVVEHLIGTDDEGRQPSYLGICTVSSSTVKNCKKRFVLCKSILIIEIFCGIVNCLINNMGRYVLLVGILVFSIFWLIWDPEFGMTEVFEVY